jgi:hypothetical protein
VGACVKICTSELNKQISILKRSTSAVSIGDSDGDSDFELIESPWSKVRTIKGSRRFKGIAIDEKTTHLFEIRYQPELMKLNGAGETFISLENPPIKSYYKIIDITNIDEQNVKLVFQCTERGDMVGEASHA